jgi:hypothetical protein
VAYLNVAYLLDKDTMQKVAWHMCRASACAIQATGPRSFSWRRDGPKCRPFFLSYGANNTRSDLSKRPEILRLMLQSLRWFIYLDKELGTKPRKHSRKTAFSTTHDNRTVEVVRAPQV